MAKQVRPVFCDPVKRSGPSRPSPIRNQNAHIPSWPEQISRSSKGRIYTCSHSLRPSVVFSLQTGWSPYIRLLGIVFAIEAILITSFLLISQNRRAELDYEVNVRSYRKLKKLQETLAALTQRLAVLEEKQAR